MVRGLDPEGLGLVTFTAFLHLQGNAEMGIKIFAGARENADGRRQTAHSESAAFLSPSGIKEAAQPPTSENTDDYLRIQKHPSASNKRFETRALEHLAAKPATFKLKYKL